MHLTFLFKDILNELVPTAGKDVENGDAGIEMYLLKDNSWYSLANPNIPETTTVIYLHIDCILYKYG